jgi:hypothetical protein
MQSTLILKVFNIILKIVLLITLDCEGLVILMPCGTNMSQSKLNSISANDFFVLRGPAFLLC